MHPSTNQTEPSAAAPALLDELHEARMGADAHEIAVLTTRLRGAFTSPIGARARAASRRSAGPRPSSVAVFAASGPSALRS